MVSARLLTLLGQTDPPGLVILNPQLIILQNCIKRGLSPVWERVFGVASNAEADTGKGQYLCP